MGRSQVARAVVLCGALVATAACGGDDETDPPVVSIPVEVQACDRPADTAAAQRRLGQIEEFLDNATLAAADGGTVTHAAFEVALDELDLKALAQAAGTNWTFSRDSEVLEPDEAEVATSPIATTWAVGGARVELWTCFDGTSVTVSRNACPDQ